MGIIYEIFSVPNLHRYEKEFNADGTEKHIVCEGARYHTLRYSTAGVRCSEPNCEMNRGTQGKKGDEHG